jgi:hypothetical protein
MSTHAPLQQTPPPAHAAPFCPQDVGLGLGVRLGVELGVAVMLGVVVLMGVAVALGVAVGLCVGVAVGLADTQVPFWHSWPTSSHEWQMWSVPQTSQSSPQSAAVQQPPG